MSELYMIRHGQASFGEKNYDRLSPKGVAQAEIIARHWVAMGRKIDAIYVGSMERQINTADALVSAFNDRGMPVPDINTEEAFNEYDSESVLKSQIPGMIQENPATAEKLPHLLRDKKIFHELFHQAMNRWVSGSCNVPGNTTWNDFKYRVQGGVQGIMQTQGAQKRLVIFTSGGPISVAVQKALGLTDQMAMTVSWQIMNASITRFKYNAQGIALAGFNDVTHLELENDKNLLTYR
jgi:broad specificity phosphatase PhoE